MIPLIKPYLKRDNRYVVDEFISKEAASYLHKILKHDIEMYPNEFKKETHKVSKDNYLPLVALMCEKTAWLNVAMAEAMLPTYAKATMYSKGAYYTKHKDNSACELTIAIQLSESKWAFNLQHSEEEVAHIIVKPGDAIIYEGHTLEHWRETPLEEDECSIAYLHYVSLKNENRDLFFTIK